MAMSWTTLAPLWALVSFITFKVVSSIVTAQHNARRARALKCQDPPTLKKTLPFGIDLLKRALAADKAKQFPEEVTARFIEAGSNTYRFTALGTTVIATADEKNIQAILATQFKDFDLGPLRRANFFPLLGDGIFTQDGSAWQHSRAMMRPQFARDQVSDLDLEEEHVQHLMKAITIKPDGWTDVVDLQVLFFRLTLDTATEFLFGESVNSQLANLPGYEKPAGLDPSHDEAVFASAFDQGQIALATRARLQDKYWLYRSKEFDKACNQCHDFIDHFVRLALSKKQGENELEKGQEKEKYVFAEAIAAQTRDPVELRSQLLHILLAGRDTTASLLGWLFLYLSRDPKRYAKLRETVIENFGTFENPSEITFAKLKSCQYLQYCNNEALRLNPVVPVNGRTANKDTTLPRGGGPDGKSPIFVPAGRRVDYSVHAMHHRKDIWGDDVEEFNPERWEGRRVGWEYLPFNGGPRICIGQQFAITEVSYVTVRLIQRFDKMENVEAAPLMRHHLTLTSCTADGVNVKMHAAAP